MTASPGPNISVIVQAEPLLVPVATAARLLGLSTRTFERLSKAGRLPSPVRLGRRRLWRFRDLIWFVDHRCRLDGHAST